VELWPGNQPGTSSRGGLSSSRDSEGDLKALFTIEIFYGRDLGILRPWGFHGLEELVDGFDLRIVRFELLVLLQGSERAV
jgi:hypothetical protein